jgi:hypothetical protein
MFRGFTRYGFVLVLFAAQGCGSGDSSNPCSGVNCSSRGFCEPVQGAPYCACIGGYHPVDLACVRDDPDDPCLGNECFGHGACGVIDGDPRCTCEPGYQNLSGPDCDTLQCDLICAPVPPSDGGGEADDGAVCVPAGPERCNLGDDDCDGLTDEDFDLDFDLANCGACGAVCADAARGVGACVLGDCTMTCVAGWADLDGDPTNGCEATCTPDPAHAESECNGVDDDCDGLTDEDWTTIDGCGEGICRRSSICHGGTITCRPRLPPAATDETCDGLDDDCDGLTDEDCAAADADADGDAGPECGNGTREGTEECDTTVPESCGRCGEGTRTCQSDCTWGGCSGTGCAPDDTQPCGICGDNGTQTCGGDCGWGSCDIGPTRCNSASDCYTCATGCTSCCNTSNCYYNACLCDSPGVPTSCTTGAGCAGTRTCSGSCSWSSCVATAATCTDVFGAPVCSGSIGTTPSGCAIDCRRCTCSSGSWTSCGACGLACPV